jgi:uncharacterized membrane protein SirB2
LSGAFFAADALDQTSKGGKQLPGCEELMVQAFCDWLSNTRVSLMIQSILWIVPAVQSVHILCVSLVMSSVAMLDLRLMGFWGRRQPISRMVDRLLPWVWYPLIVLAATGLVLIVGEPARELPNWAFRAKMAMLAIVILITFIVQRRSRRIDNYWESRQVAAGLTGLVSLLLWVGIVTAGRWIAYV